MRFGRTVHVGALMLAVVLVIGGCSRRPSSPPGLEFVLETEPRAYDGAALSDDRIAELRAEVARRQALVEQTVRDYGHIASFNRQLAEALLQLDMYEPALEALQRARAVQAENAVLYYWAGVAAARSAKAHPIDGRGTELLHTAADMYERAIGLRADYREALYAAALLLAFELDRPEQALPYAERAARLETGDPRMAFLLANILVRLDRLQEAIDLYGRLERSAPSEQQRRQAVENRNRLLEELRARS